MGAIIEFILGKTFLRAGLKVVVFTAIAALFITATNAFMSSMLTLVTSTNTTNTVSTYMYILSAMLPANTTTFISTIFTAQLTAIIYSKTMFFIHSKRQIFGSI